MVTGESCVTAPAAAGYFNLANLVWTDSDVIHEEAVPEVFGDRYLCCGNSLFARVRHLFLALGFRYSSEATRFWRDYDAMSLLMLQDILDTGVVPYRDNMTVLGRIAKRNPALQLSYEQLMTLVQRNYLLHESAHCISYRSLSRYFGVTGPSGNKRDYVMVSLLCESYANAVERLGSILATGATHQIFYNMNSFAEAVGGQFLRDCVSVFGVLPVFLVAVLVFFHHNTHDTGLTEPAKDLIYELAVGAHRLGVGEQALMRALIANGFTLNKKFRAETTPLFFQYLECESEFREFSNVAFDPQTFRSLGISNSLSDLIHFTCDQLAFPASAPGLAVRQGSGEMTWHTAY